ncbi:hypothetical protein ARTHRO9AX_80190 [Arthrobacter sp. 9AX]|nr:hypothetical protein ARTHRO9AX_80190 [Arthrobacter sp. 9AX]
MKATSGRVLLIVLACIVVGLILMWWSTVLPVPWGALVSTFGAVVITVGLVNGVSDLFLRQTVARDLMSYMASDRRLVESGLDGMQALNNVDWSSFVPFARTIQCYTNDPSSFRTLIWHHILDRSAERPKEVELHFLDPSSSTLETVANQLGQESNTYRSILEEVIQDVEDDWKKSKRHKKSSLVIRTTQAPARHAYLRCDQRYALFIDPLDGHRGQNYALLLRSDRGTYPSIQWLDDSINRFQSNSKAPRYSDRAEENDDHLIEE